jgi:hypothetical protein
MHLLQPYNIFLQSNFIAVIEAIKVATAFRIVWYTVYVFFKMNTLAGYNDLYSLGSPFPEIGGIDFRAWENKYEGLIQYSQSL